MKMVRNEEDEIVVVNGRLNLDQVQDHLQFMRKTSFNEYPMRLKELKAKRNTGNIDSKVNELVSQSSKNHTLQMTANDFDASRGKY